MNPYESPRLTEDELVTKRQHIDWLLIVLAIAVVGHGGLYLYAVFNAATLFDFLAGSANALLFIRRGIELQDRIDLYCQRKCH